MVTLASKAKSRSPAARGSATDSGASHDADPFAWAIQQAALLRDRRLDTIDAVNIADEIADLAHYLVDKLRSDLVRVMQHLLKWDHQPGRRSRSWMLTIREHRRRVALHLRKAPGLRSVLAETIDDAYADARYQALIETDLPESTLPESCPHTWDEIMSRPIEWPEQP